MRSNALVSCEWAHAPRRRRGSALTHFRRCAGAAVVTLVVACSPANTEPPPKHPDSATLRDPAELAPGTHVLVERGGQWIPATIMGRIARGRVMVRYDGYGPEWDEAVPAQRVQIAFGGNPPAADYRVGEKVLVITQGKQLLADVVAQVGNGVWRVHYDGYGPEVAENVKPDRLRRPFAGKSAHATGEQVSLDVGGKVLPARILIAVAADRWLVRFDGFGPEYDQEVTADRLQSADASADAGATAAPAPPEAVGSGAFKANENVLVAHRGAYHPATIVGPGAAGRWRVRYTTSAVGNEQSLSGSDEEVAADRVSHAVAPKKGARYGAGQRVFVVWHGMYFPGKITKRTADGLYRIRYEGFGPEADEMVPARRLRPRP